MRVGIIIENAKYGKFSDLKLNYIDNSNARTVLLSLKKYEKIFDFTTDFTSVNFDFFLISMVVYGVDNLISRELYSNDGWSRDIEIEFPVNNQSAWSGKEAELKQILDFLTGDNWQVSFREITNVVFYQPRMNRRKITRYNKESINAVSLFSGGLDSLIGVIDQLEKLNKDERILLVSHFDSNSPGPNRDQSVLYSHLRNKNPDQIYWLQANLSLSRKDTEGNEVKVESNYRSRSLLFIGFGCYLSPINELLIPENGTITINYPLTPSRVSSLSTRTTHPYVLKKIQELFIHLELPTRIYNRYKFKTKGEMFLECANQNLLRCIYQDSVSCGKRGRRQFHFDNPSANHNCGRCMPCIYRRAALNKAGLDDEMHYGNFITKVLTLGNNDLPALFSYLKRDISLEKMKRDLLVNGNIEISELTDYAEMVLRSKDEVLQLFRDKGNNYVKTELHL